MSRKRKGRALRRRYGHAAYNVNGHPFDTLQQALDAAGHEAQIRLAKRVGKKAHHSSQDITASTVKVIREDGTVAASVRPG